MLYYYTIVFGFICINCPRCHGIPLQLSHLSEAVFGDLDVAVAHLHVDPQSLHHRQTVLVVPQVLWSIYSLGILNQRMY